MKAVKKNIFGTEKERPGSAEYGTIYWSLDTKQVFLYDSNDRAVNISSMSIEQIMEDLYNLNDVNQFTDFYRSKLDAVNISQQSLHEYLTYNSQTDTIQATRLIETLLATFRLGGHLSLSSAGLSLIVSNIARGTSSIFAKLSFKDHSIPQNRTIKGLEKARFYRISENSSDFEPNGPIAPSGSTSYRTTLTIFQNNLTFGVNTIIEENLIPTDYLHYTIYSGVDDTGIAIYEQVLTNNNLVAGDSLIWDFKPLDSEDSITPFQGEEGDVITVVLQKSSNRDGNRVDLQVRASLNDSNKHWSNTHSRTFIEVLIDMNNTELLDNVNIDITEPTVYLIDSTNNTSTLNVYNDSSLYNFSIRDSEKKFNVNNVTVNFYDIEGGSIQHTVILDKKDKAFFFNRVSNIWYYSENKGETILIGSSHTASVDFLNESYSLQEKIISKKWSNGKDIYEKKLIVPDGIGDGGDVSIALGFTVGEFFKIESGLVVRQGTGDFLPLPYVDESSNHLIGVKLNSSKTTLHINAGGDIDFNSGWIVIQYTKQ